MDTLDLDQIFKDVIEKKHQELNLGKNYIEKFSKIRDFEGNAVGQIGEEFIKCVVSSITDIIDDGVIHDEYDILTQNGISFEIKTARKGRNNNTFQFNGINPDYNYNYLICLGICEDKILYRIFLKSQIKYIHNERNHYVIQGDYKRQLVHMNPNNLVNLKLTININDLKEIVFIIEELKNLLN